MMGFYERRILPHIINLAMNTKVLKEERTRCLRDVKGVVLEIGFGTGLNLPHYPPTVTKIVGVDPSETSAKLARKRIAAAPVPVETIGLSAEKLPVPDGSFDSIVSTFTLCTIPDVVSALSEVRRVLRPGAPFVVSFSNRCFPTKAVAVWPKEAALQKFVFPRPKA